MGQLGDSKKMLPECPSDEVAGMHTQTKLITRLGYRNVTQG